MSGLFHNILENLFGVFRGRNLTGHFLAIILTYLFVVSGFDWWYFQATRGATLQTFFWPSVLLGAFVPLFGILLFCIFSVIRRNRQTIFVACSLGQAALFGILTSDFYKFFTGRPGPPDIVGDTVIADTSHIFRFGILRGGIFFGWPSSHTVIAFAMAATLWMLFPKNKLIKYLSIIYALYIGLGISVTIHWFSDFAAGAIIGIVIGSVVGKSFREQNSF